MTTFELLIPRLQAEAFNTAVFRFLETQQDAPDVGLLKMRTEPRGEHEAKVVTLWSDEAVRAFGRFWATFPKRSVLGPV